eukprot:CAMPEP_0181136896 /NCGR_PEP_ID=MMETSP1071-20121207/33417_1 /TAXON_ID=35127 /ORGANISM="Thalassiosira sp., Strain NH16" /LENGTH=401 /DNA_ID=CAMNT_0023223615 /DNA_START=298 /DNA_END=1503 /DNA_ORIENTATION=+
MDVGSSQPTNRNIREIIRTETRGYDIDSPNNVPKRSNYLSWNDYFLSVAYLSAQRSKDPHPSKNSRNGACIVDTMGRIVGIGYDGFPRGCSDDCLPWASSTSTSAEDGITKEELAWLHTKEPYLCHAEINAILNKCSSDVVGGRMFVPSGIKEIIFVKDEDSDSESSRASRILLEVSGVKMTKIQPSIPLIHIKFDTGSSCTSKRRKLNKNIDPNEDEMEKYVGLLQREASIDPFKYTVHKRTDYLTWDEYFMGVAFLSAQRSKDPNTQVGACIVNAEKCIIGIGYNGFPRGCSDEVLPWARSASCDLHKKYPYVVHAEVNAILNKCSASVRGATLYVALFPCNECSKVIIQSGIREVVYLNDCYHGTDSCKASRIMFKMAGVKLRQYKPENEEIVIDFGS